LLHEGLGLQPHALLLAQNTLVLPSLIHVRMAYKELSRLTAFRHIDDPADSQLSTSLSLPPPVEESCPHGNSAIMRVWIVFEEEPRSIGQRRSLPGTSFPAGILNAPPPVHSALRRNYSSPDSRWGFKNQQYGPLRFKHYVM
jgi:hypothetical protein